MRDIEQVKADVKRGLRQMDESEETYIRAQMFYEGDDPEVFLSDEHRAVLREAVSAFRVNYASVPVDVVADRLFISGFTGMPKSLETVLDDNEFWSWSNDLMRETQKYGDYYVGVWASVDTDLDPELEEALPSKVVLSPLDPISTRVIYDEELERIPEFAIRRWPMEVKTANGRSQKIVRITVTYADEIYKFFIKKGSDLSKLAPWEEDGEVWPLPNVAGELNIIHFRTGLPYGKPGHQSVYGVQQIVTKTILNMMVNVDFMGLGQRAILKDPNKAGQAKPQLTARTKDGSPIPVQEGTQGRPGLTSGPGKVWEIFAEAVHQFTATDASGFLEILNWGPNAAAQSSRLPQRFFADPSGQAPSGESQSQGDKVLEKRVGAARGNHAAAFKRLWRVTSIVNNTGEVKVETEWERDEVTMSKTYWDSVTVVTTLIDQATTDPGIWEFMMHNFQEQGYTLEEATSFIGEKPVEKVIPAAIQLANQAAEAQLANTNPANPVPGEPVQGNN